MLHRIKIMKNNEKIQGNHDLYQFILSLVPKFVEIKSSDINDAIESALGKISDYVKSERAYIYLF